MPQADINSISINYEFHRAEGNSAQTVVLVNGLADDLNTWDPQVPALTKAGYSVLRYDNRGIGRSASPPGPYTSQILADDLHALLKYTSTIKFHLIGLSMGGMIAQTYALSYPNGSTAADGHEMLSVSLCCTYAEPTAFCSRMFELWADMAVRMSIQDVMRDVILWCFTVNFVRTRSSDLAEIDQAMEHISMSQDAYLAQLNVIQKFDTTGVLKQLQSQGERFGNLDQSKVLVLAGEEDILIPTQLSRELHELLTGSQWKTVKGGHGCAVSSVSMLASYLTSRSAGVPRRLQPGYCIILERLLLVGIAVLVNRVGRASSLAQYTSNIHFLLLLFLKLCSKWCLLCLLPVEIRLQSRLFSTCARLPVNSILDLTLARCTHLFRLCTPRQACVVLLALGFLSWWCAMDANA